MVKLFQIVLFALLTASAAAAEPGHCFRRCPAGDAIARDAYAVSINDRTKFADWVAYRISSATLGPTRPRRWQTDPDLAPAQRLEPQDYAGAYHKLAMDRGHLAPLASISGLSGWAAANYLSNVAPQRSSLNRGPWARLEAAERMLIQRHGFDAVHVLTGPLYEADMPDLPAASKAHRVPSGYWKLLLAIRGGVVHGAAFAMGQDMARDAAYCAAREDIESLERRTGLDLPDEDLTIQPLDPLIGCAP